MATMDVELIVVPDCPNERPAAALLRAALDDVGLTGVQFTTTVIDTERAADQRRFTGSPTFLINGTDPFAVHPCEPALACRALRQAIKRQADPNLLEDHSTYTDA